jgi:hypothetical protein
MPASLVGSPPWREMSSAVRRVDADEGEVGLGVERDPPEGHHRLTQANDMAIRSFIADHLGVAVDVLGRVRPR